MTMVDPGKGWFEITEVPYYKIDYVKNNEHNYIDKNSFRISRLFGKTWLGRYPQPREVIFDSGSKFKMHFMSL